MSFFSTESTISRNRGCHFDYKISFVKLDSDCDLFILFILFIVGQKHFNFLFLFLVSCGDVGNGWTGDLN